MDRKAKKTLVVALFIAVLTLSIGYAALSSSLNIKGIANVLGEKWQVNFVKDESTSTPEGQAKCNIGTIEDTSITDLSAIFKAPGDSCVFTVPVENTGTLSASLTDVLEKESNLSFTGIGATKEDDETLLNDYVIYEVNYGGTIINKNTNFNNIYTLEPGEKEIVTLKVTFKSEATKVPKASVTVGGLDRTFVFENKQSTSVAESDTKYSIKYVGFDSAGFKTRIQKGKTLLQNLGKSVDVCSVTMGDKELSLGEYALDNFGAIGIPNVTGNIIINGQVDEQVKETPITMPNAPELNGDMIPVYYDEDVEKWKKADVNNASNNWYDYTNQKWANAVTVKDEKTIQDLSGNGNEGTIFGANVSNGVASFDGTDDYIACGLENHSFVNSAIDKEQVTLAMRLKINTLKTKEIDFLSNFEQGGIGLIYNYNSNNKLTFLVNISGVGYVPVEADITTGVYYTVVGTYDGEYLKLYLNGELKDSRATTGKIKIAKPQFLIASNPDKNGLGNVYYSKIDVTDTLIFDKVLSGEEVQQHYAGEVSLGDTKPLLYYDFDKLNSSRNKYKNSEKGTIIPMDEINTMWVWIPRYSYTIRKNACGESFGKGTYINTKPTRELPGEIDVKFVGSEITDLGSAQYSGSNAANWRTNEAFNFGGVPQAGLWVGKFETTGSISETCTNEACNASEITILPNQTSIKANTISSFFYMSRSMQKNNAETYGFSKDKGDLHMMKNDEWGAVAYLSQSRYGKFGNKNYSGANKQIYINNSSSYKTGISGGGPSVSDSGAHYEYNDMTVLEGQGTGQAGPGASTTGTIYGVYDMSGGTYEYVMGVLEYDEQGSNTYNGQIATGLSEFNGLDSSGNPAGSVALPNKKYYNTYKSAKPTSALWTTAKPELACDGGVCYGHALSETYGATSGTYGWYKDYNGFVDRPYPWFRRGGIYSGTTSAGIFYAQFYDGSLSAGDTIRLVLM